MTAAESPPKEQKPISYQTMDNAELVRLLETLRRDFPKYSLYGMGVALITTYLYALHVSNEDKPPAVALLEMDDTVCTLFASIISSLHATVGSNTPKEKLQ